MISDQLLLCLCFNLRAHRLQDETSGSVQEEPGGAGRAGAQTRKGKRPGYCTVTLINNQCVSLAWHKDWKQGGTVSLNLCVFSMLAV